MSGPKPEKPVEDLLVERQLGHIDEDDGAWLERRLDLDAPLKERDRALARVLERLDAHWIPPTPVNLSEKVLRYVEANRASPCTSPAPAVSAVEAAPAVRLVRFSLRDLLAVAACLTVFLGAMIPTMQRLHSHARRVRCAGNLESIYQALGTYGREFNGALPHAGTLTGASWLYAAPNGAPHVSNSRHPYLLVGFGFLGDEGPFRCPASPAPLSKPLAERSANDFSEPAACSYDSLNMSGPTPGLYDAPAQAYMGDPNPLFVDGVFRESVNPNNTNSPLHDKGRGQNVLTLDGSVDWLNSPFRNRRDNVWLAGDRQHYTGTETQTDSDDAFLVPATPAARKP